MSGGARPNAVRSRFRRWLLTEGYGFSPTDVTLYGFDGDRPLTDAARYLGYRTYLSEVRPKLNHPRAHALTENKWVFQRLLASFGVPMPLSYGLLHPTFGVTWDGRPLRSPGRLIAELRVHRPSSMVLKAAGGLKQQRLAILHDIDHESGAARLNTGERTTVGEVLGGLQLRARGYPGYVAQEYVEQHAFLRGIAPATPNTVRVVTLLTAKGKVDVSMAAVRLGRQGNMADGWNAGGLSVGIDVASGRLGEGVQKSGAGAGRHTIHPDTGVRFTGRTVPEWDRVVDLCRQSARLFPGARSLGWDVLLTDDGPLILEANSDWDLQMVQVHTDGLLARTSVREELARSRIALPSSSRREALGRAMGRLGRRRRARR